MEVDPPQHLFARAVGEAHPLEVDGEVSRWQGDAIGRLLHIDRGGQHAQDLPPPGNGDLGLIEDLAQLRDRDEEQVHQEHEGDQLA